MKRLERVAALTAIILPCVTAPADELDLLVEKTLRMSVRAEKCGCGPNGRI